MAKTATEEPILVKLAKRGNVSAIASLIRQALPTLTAVRVSQHKGTLQICLEGTRVPDRATVVPVIQQGLEQLSPPGVYWLKIQGQQSLDLQPDWEEMSFLQVVAPASASVVPSAGPIGAEWELESQRQGRSPLPRSPGRRSIEAPAIEFKATESDLDHLFEEVIGQQPQTQPPSHRSPSDAVAPPQNSQDFAAFYENSGFEGTFSTVEALGETSDQVLPEPSPELAPLSAENLLDRNPHSHVSMAPLESSPRSSQAPRRQRRSSRPSQGASSPSSASPSSASHSSASRSASSSRSSSRSTPSRSTPSRSSASRSTPSQDATLEWDLNKVLEDGVDIDEMLGNLVKNHQKEIFIVFLLLFVPLLGFIAMWTLTKWPKPVKGWITGIRGFFWLVGL